MLKFGGKKLILIEIEGNRTHQFRITADCARWTVSSVPHYPQLQPPDRRVDSGNYIHNLEIYLAEKYLNKVLLSDCYNLF